MFIELAKYGEIEKLNVCDNVGDHLVGSEYNQLAVDHRSRLSDVYVRYRYEEDASKAAESLNDRFYAGNIFATEAVIYTHPQVIV